MLLLEHELCSATHLRWVKNYLMLGKKSFTMGPLCRAGNPNPTKMDPEPISLLWGWPEGDQSKNLGFFGDDHQHNLCACSTLSELLKNICQEILLAHFPGSFPSASSWLHTLPFIYQVPAPSVGINCGAVPGLCLNARA